MPLGFGKAFEERLTLERSEIRNIVTCIRTSFGGGALRGHGV
jgi:hypothetical protein